MVQMQVGIDRVDRATRRRHGGKPEQKQIP